MFRKKGNWWERTYGVKDRKAFEALAWIVADIPRLKDALAAIEEYRNPDPSDDHAWAAGEALQQWLFSTQDVTGSQDRRQSLVCWFAAGVLPYIDWKSIARWLLRNEEGLRREMRRAEEDGLWVASAIHWRLKPGGKTGSLRRKIINPAGPGTVGDTSG